MPHSRGGALAGVGACAGGSGICAQLWQWWPTSDVQTNAPRLGVHAARNSAPRRSGFIIMRSYWSKDGAPPCQA